MPLNALQAEPARLSAGLFPARVRPAIAWRCRLSFGASRIHPVRSPSEDFSDCIGGPGTDVVEACSCPDVDDDQDVDIVDFVIFQASITCSP